MKLADVYPPHPPAGLQHINVAAMGLKTQPALTKWRLPSLRLIGSLVLSGGGGGVGAAATSLTDSLRRCEALKQQRCAVPFTSCGRSLVGFLSTRKRLDLDAVGNVVRECCAVKLWLWISEHRRCDGSLHLSPVFVKNQMRPQVRLWPEDLGDLMWFPGFFLSL